MSLRLRLQFDDAPSFHEEFRRNISKGGAFLSCAEATELRAIVEVELDLAFCGEHLVLEAEVVHVVPGSGVAVEFLKPAVELRDELAVFLSGDVAPPPEPGLELETSEPASEGPASTGPDALSLEDSLDLPAPGSGEGDGLGDLLDNMDERVTVDAEPTQDPVWALPDEAEELAPLEGEPAPVAAPMPAMTQRSAQVVVEEASDEPVEAPAPPDDPLANATDQRRAHRSVARLAVRLDTQSFSLDGRTRDLSQTGVLVSADGSELPIGKLIRLELEHPIPTF